MKFINITCHTVNLILLLIIFKNYKSCLLSSKLLQGYYDQFDNSELQDLIPRELADKKDVLFGNIKDIYAFHSQLVSPSKDWPWNIWLSLKVMFSLSEVYLLARLLLCAWVRECRIGWIKMKSESASIHSHYIHNTFNVGWRMCSLVLMHCMQIVYCMFTIALCLIFLITIIAWHCNVIVIVVNCYFLFWW